MVFVHVPPGNHIKILKHAGFEDIREYRYYKKDTRSLDFNGICEDLEVTKLLVHVMCRATFTIIPHNYNCTMYLASVARSMYVTSVIDICNKIEI